MGTIKIIDYKAGNAPSVMHAVARLGYGHNADFARSAADLSGASHIILPGVGSARATMDSLDEMGLRGALENAVLRDGILFWGICVGMQILFEHSEEGDADCLGWLPGKVVKFDAAKVRVPQMGWNHVRFVKDVAGCRRSADAMEDCFYFVNSYYAKPENESDLWGTADDGGHFAAAVCRGNIRATQFHIEKSGPAGLELLGGFLGCKNGGEKC
jgi:glutamine amidotransferase